jgi:hypothetical protein
MNHPLPSFLLTFIIIETLCYSHIVFHFMHKYCKKITYKNLQVWQTRPAVTSCVCSFVSEQQNEGKRSKVQALSNRTFMETSDEEIYTGILETDQSNSVTRRGMFKSWAWSPNQISGHIRGFSDKYLHSQLHFSLLLRTCASSPYTWLKLIPGARLPSLKSKHFEPICYIEILEFISLLSTSTISRMEIHWNSYICK